MNWRKLLGRPEPHQHAYTWRAVPDRVECRVWADCTCGQVSWAATVRTSEELKAALRRAFQSGALSALGYYTAPVEIPDLVAA